MLSTRTVLGLAVAVFILFVFNCNENGVQSAIVNCRCGPKPWSTRDVSNQKHSAACCQYFIESGEGNYTKASSLCHIENEYIYKRFHSCCINRLKSAYCYQQQIGEDGGNGLKPVQDPWAKYEKIFGKSPFGRR